MLTPTQRGVAANLSHLQTLGPDDRVQLYNVLEPGNRAHAYIPVSVSTGQMAALKAANDAIDDTWQILNHGSGNQHGHVQSSQGESYKRTALAYTSQIQSGAGYPQQAYIAASVQAGNCDHMAAVNALLLSASNINDRVSLVHASDIGHAFVQVGDERAPGGTVISDAWPEFGRALRAKDFSLAGQHPQIVETYNARYNPEVRASLLNAAKYSQQEIDTYFAQVDPARGHLDKSTLTHNLLNSPDVKLYKQVHASNNLGVSYQNSRHSPAVIDQSLPLHQFNDRLVKSSHPPVTQPEPSWEHTLDISVERGW